jgi:hypothetical protein
MNHALRNAELELELIGVAKAYALEKHGKQTHGSLSISDHLHMVTARIESEYTRCFPTQDIPLVTLLQAGWLHDVLEDTDATEQEILDIFGSDVTNIVVAVTDGPGKTRMERHLNTYYRTRRSKGGVFVKMSDRWHNQHRSLVNKELRFAKDYANEYDYFKFALYEFPVFSPFWKQLDQQAEALKAFVDSPTVYLTATQIQNKARIRVKELTPCVSVNPTNLRPARVSCV